MSRSKKGQKKQGKLNKRVATDSSSITSGAFTHSASTDLLSKVRQAVSEGGNTKSKLSSRAEVTDYISLGRKASEIPTENDDEKTIKKKQNSYYARALDKFRRTVQSRTEASFDYYGRALKEYPSELDTSLAFAPISKNVSTAGKEIANSLSSYRLLKPLKDTLANFERYGTDDSNRGVMISVKPMVIQSEDGSRFVGRLSLHDKEIPGGRPQSYDSLAYDTETLQPVNLSIAEKSAMKTYETSGELSSKDSAHLEEVYKRNQRKMDSGVGILDKRHTKSILSSLQSFHSTVSKVPKSEWSETLSEVDRDTISLLQKTNIWSSLNTIRKYKDQSLARKAAKKSGTKYTEPSDQVTKTMASTARKTLESEMSNIGRYLESRLSLSDTAASGTSLKSADTGTKFSGGTRSGWDPLASLKTWTGSAITA